MTYNCEEGTCGRFFPNQDQLAWHLIHDHRLGPATLKMRYYIYVDPRNNTSTKEPIIDAKVDVKDVANQDHYTQNKFQPIDVMEMDLSHEEFRGFLKGNVIKYIMRYQLKDGEKDLKKAQVYLKWLIEHEYHGGITHDS